jgi:hypothetical protein
MTHPEIRSKSQAFEFIKQWHKEIAEHQAFINERSDWIRRVQAGFPFFPNDGHRKTDAEASGAIQLAIPSPVTKKMPPRGFYYDDLIKFFKENGAARVKDVFIHLHKLHGDRINLETVKSFLKRQNKDARSGIIRDPNREGFYLLRDPQ